MKTNLFKYILISAAALFMLASCTKQSIDSNQLNLPVVEAYLIPGQLVTVKLYQQKQLTDTAKYGQPITGLQVYISDGSKNILLTETAKGTYTYNNSTFLATGKTYSLQFNYLGASVTAQTVMPARPVNFAIKDTVIHILSTMFAPNTPLDTLTHMTWSNPDSLNHVLVFKNLTGAGFPVRSFGGRGFASNNQTNGSIEINTNRTAAYYVTQNSFTYYANYKIILMRVNLEYIQLIKSNTNTATSQTLTNTYTNITNGYGIFTAMQGDTLAMTVYEN